MVQALLTSAGLENPRILQALSHMLPQPARQIRALFLPTAAIDEDARAVPPKCWKDLLDLGVPEAHITVCDLDRPLSAADLAGYGLIYVCGGSTEHLAARMRAQGFAQALPAFFAESGVYVGVSAGSLVAAGNCPGGLGLVAATLRVHRPCGATPGPLDPAATRPLDLTNAQAIRLMAGRADILQ